jgi:hypothetical protein
MGRDELDIHLAAEIDSRPPSDNFLPQLRTLAFSTLDFGEFWRCVESGEPPRLFGVEPPQPRIEAIRIVDMSATKSWPNLLTFFACSGPMTRSARSLQAWPKPRRSSSIQRLCHAASALSAARGFLATMASSERAAGSGSTRPCSQLRSVAIGILKARANSVCVI